MEVKQIYDLVNTATSEALGSSVIVAEDLSNLVDIGTAIFNANAYDNYVKAIVNKIGRTIIVDRVYTGKLKKVLMDSWTYGSVVEKIHFEMPDAEENESWELTNGASYNQDIFVAPKVMVKFFNEKTTFEIPLSITDIQLRESFTSVETMNSFLSGVYTSVENKLTKATEELILRTINNFIGESYNVRATRPAVAINLLSEYITASGQSLTKASALYDKEFIRFASYRIAKVIRNMGAMSTLFNIGGTQKFTPVEDLHLILHDDFKALADVYLQSDTFHDEYTKLPNAESVSYWQGSGTTFALADTTKIDVKLASDPTTEVELDYIIGVAFDRNALGVANFDRRIPTHRNAKAEFTNLWYKQDARYFNDLNENFVVFYLA